MSTRGLHCDKQSRGAPNVRNLAISATALQLHLLLSKDSIQRGEYSWAFLML